MSDVKSEVIDKNTYGKISLGEVAAVLGVSRRTVYRYLREGSGE